MLLLSSRYPASVMFTLCLANAFVWAETAPVSYTTTSLLIIDSPTESKVVPQSSSEEMKEQSNSADAETVRERFKSGKVRIEKTVTLNEQGDFVPNGGYTEWNEKGDLVQTGTYKNGLREGAWIRIASSTEATLLQGAPYNKFKGPFQSTVEFSNGEMNGIWTIIDADNRVVSHISLNKGLRDGRVVFNLPSGTAIYEADYKNGVLDGLFFEKDAAGKTTKQLEYHEGSVRQMDRATYPNKSPKSDRQVLSGKAKLISKDNFDTFTLATYQASGEPVADGEFVNYYANGTIQSRGTYKLGQLSGKFESWHSNGERESVGNYDKGNQTGKWTSWHANGMRKSEGQYVDGLVEGKLQSWDEKGRSSPTTLVKKEQTVAPVLIEDDVELAEEAFISSTRKR